MNINVAILRSPDGGVCEARPKAAKKKIQKVTKLTCRADLVSSKKNQGGLGGTTGFVGNGDGGALA